MYEVRWINRHGKLRVNKEGVYATEEEAYQSIKDWWAKNEYEPYYVRMWRKNGKLHIDYGLHYSFYEIVDLDKV